MRISKEIVVELLKKLVERELKFLIELIATVIVALICSTNYLLINELEIPNSENPGNDKLAYRAGWRFLNVWICEAVTDGSQVLEGWKRAGELNLLAGKFKIENGGRAKVNPIRQTKQF